MRLSEFSGKEIVNMADGSRVGVIRECDLVLDEKTGYVAGVVLPRRKNVFDFRGEAQHMVIPWQTIKRIGDDIIIVDLSEDLGRAPGLFFRRQY